MPVKRKPYDWTQFTVKVEIRATPARVFRAWTNQTEITRWFVSEAILEPRKGGRFYMKFLTGVSGDETVLAIQKDRSFTFSFGPDGETVAVTLRKVAGGTDCILRQYGMKTTPQAKVDWHMGCRSGWVFFLANLKAHLEHKIDLRGTDPKKSYLNGYVTS